MQQMQQLSIRCTTTCPEAHWQNGTIERHGGFLQHMLTKIDVEVPIKTYRDLQQALNQRTQAKNAMMVHRGHSPEIMVFGKHSRLPGSILSDTSLPAHTHTQQPSKRKMQTCPMNLSAKRSDFVKWHVRPSTRQTTVMHFAVHSSEGHVPHEAITHPTNGL